MESQPCLTKLDSGAQIPIVSQKLVPDAKLTGETVLVKNIHDGIVEYPMAEVSIEVGDNKEICEVALLRG